MDVNDARVVRTRATVLGTAADIVVEGGPAALTVEAVVARSGVARSTIYRHWPTRDELLIDVFDYCAPSLLVPDAHLHFVEALRALLYDIVAAMSDPKWARLLPVMQALKAYESPMADLDRRLIVRQSVVFDGLFQRGISEGVISADFDQPQAVALLLGPLLFAAVTGTLALSTELADAALDALVRSISLPAP